MNGKKVTQAQYKKQMESYNQTYVKRGAVLPTLGIASSAANSTIALKVSKIRYLYHPDGHKAVQDQPVADGGQIGVSHPVPLPSVGHL